MYSVVPLNIFFHKILGSTCFKNITHALLLTTVKVSMLGSILCLMNCTGKWSVHSLKEKCRESVSIFTKVSKKSVSDMNEVIQGAPNLWFTITLSQSPSYSSQVWRVFISLVKNFSNFIWLFMMTNTSLQFIAFHENLPWYYFGGGVGTSILCHFSPFPALQTRSLLIT